MLFLIEQGIANVWKCSCCQQFRIDRIMHVKYILSKFTFNSKILSLNVKTFIMKVNILGLLNLIVPGN